MYEYAIGNYYDNLQFAQQDMNRMATTGWRVVAVCMEGLSLIVTYERSKAD